MLISNNINNYNIGGGMVTSANSLLVSVPQNSPKPQNLALIVTIVTVVPPMLLIVTMFLLLQLLQLLPLRGGI